MPRRSGAAAAGPSTVTPSSRRWVARSKAPGSAGSAPSAAGLAACAKSRPAFGRGIWEAMTWPSSSIAATQ